MAKPKKYRVVARTSTRASLDRESPDFDVWVDFEVGATVTEWPMHAPIDEWAASGHWEPVLSGPATKGKA